MNFSRLIIANTLVLFVLIATGSVQAQTVFDDSFADGNRAETNTGGENDTSWWTSSSSSGDEINIGPPNTLGLVTGSSGRGLHTVFPTQTLASVGDKLTATYTFTTPATVASSGGSSSFRVGLFDTLGRAALDADVNASSGSPNAVYGWSVGNGGPGDPGLPGYMLDMDVNTGSSADLNFRTHNVGSATGRLKATTGSGSFSSFSSGPDEGYIFSPNTTYTGSFSVERTGASELTLTGTLDGISYSVVDSTPGSFDFGFLGFHINSNQFGSSNSAGDPDNGIDFSNINVVSTTASTVVLGDANDDGAFNNVDIAAFVLALTDSKLYALTYPNVDPDVVLDMNGDGMFNNSDVAAFVSALTTKPLPDQVPRQVLFGENGSWPACYKLSEFYDSPDVDLAANPDHEVLEHFEADYDENDIPVIKSFVIWSGGTTPNSNNPRVEIQMKPACAVDAYTTDMRLRIRSRVISLSPMGPNATKPFETVTLGQIHQDDSQSDVETDIVTIGYRGPTQGMVVAAGGSWASNITVDPAYALGDIFEAELILNFGGIITYTYENLTTGVTSSGTVGTLPGSDVGDIRFQGFNYLQQDGRDYSGNDGSEVWLYLHEIF